MSFPEAIYKEVLEMTEMPTLYQRRETLCRELFQSICEDNDHKLFNLRSQSKYILPTFKKNRFKNSFINHYVSEAKR